MVTWIHLSVSSQLFRVLEQISVGRTAREFWHHSCAFVCFPTDGHRHLSQTPLWTLTHVWNCADWRWLEHLGCLLLKTTLRASEVVPGNAAPIWKKLDCAIVLCVESMCLTIQRTVCPLTAVSTSHCKLLQTRDKWAWCASEVSHSTLHSPLPHPGFGDLGLYYVSVTDICLELIKERVSQNNVFTLLRVTSADLVWWVHTFTFSLLWTDSNLFFLFSNCCQDTLECFWHPLVLRPHYRWRRLFMF